MTINNIYYEESGVDQRLSLEFDKTINGESIPMIVCHYFIPIHDELYWVFEQLSLNIVRPKIY